MCSLAWICVCMCVQYVCVMFRRDIMKFTEISLRSSVLNLEKINFWSRLPRMSVVKRLEDSEVTILSDKSEARYLP